VKIEIKDTGEVHVWGGDVWTVTIGGKRRRVVVWQGSGFYGASSDCNVACESLSLREAIAMAVSPEVDFVDQRDDSSEIRRAVRDLTRCLEVRAAMRGAKLPKLRSAK
jgi:hypothetical protein